MSLPDQIFKPERYTYQDYLLWKGDWELVNGYPYAMDHLLTEIINGFPVNLYRKRVMN